MAKKKKTIEAAELDEVRVHGPITVTQINDRTVELSFTISGSVELEDGTEFMYDEQVSVRSDKCMIENPES